MIYRSYDYNIDSHRLKIFPATLKEATLRWFMSLGRDTVQTWEDMKIKFLEKYKEYYRGSDMRGGDIFRMQ